MRAARLRKELEPARAEGRSFRPGRGRLQHKHARIVMGMVLRPQFPRGKSSSIRVQAAAHARLEIMLAT